MINSKRSVKLAHKLSVSSLAAFIVSTALFLILQNTSYYILNIYCSDPEVIAEHLKKKADSLQQYITVHELSLLEFPQLDHWVGKGGLTEIFLYGDNNLLYSSKPSYPNFLTEELTQQALSLQPNTYTLTFADGEALVIIQDLFEHRYRDYSTYFNLFLFLLCFIAIMNRLIRKKVAYIDVLEQEIRILGGGDLNYAITVQGNDELSSLAKEIDEMRKAFISREQYANRVSAASRELMTGISHDLRTPLTALIGYLEVLEGEDVPATQSPYLKKCQKRAEQIKSLINNLFEYFFVSTNAPEQIQLTIHPVQEGLAEIINDQVFLLRQNGFLVHSRIQFPKNKLKINRNMIQRVFDNLFSNLRRYADPAHPIILASRVENYELIIEMRNHVLVSPEIYASTGLGFKTCTKILSQHQGRFIHQQQEDIYTIQCIFPLI